MRVETLRRRPIDATALESIDLRPHAENGEFRVLRRHANASPQLDRIGRTVAADSHRWLVPNRPIERLR
jgi:hypothetical protein